MKSALIVDGACGPGSRRRRVRGPLRLERRDPVSHDALHGAVDERGLLSLARNDPSFDDVQTRCTASTTGWISSLPDPGALHE